MNKLNFLLFCLLFSTNIKAQQFLPENRVVVLGNSAVKLPADQVLVTVKLNFEDVLSPQKAYDKHKVKENELVSLLKNLKIPNKNVNYSLLSISKVENYDNSQQRKFYFNTDQSVQIKLDSINKYTQFTLKLLEKGFSDFQAEFSSSQSDNFKNELIEKAIEAAKEKASTMARVAGRKVGKILKIGDTEEIDSIFGYNYTVSDNNELKFNNIKPSLSLTGIEQQVEYFYKVKVVFELE